jgi:hypothetical protein
MSQQTKFKHLVIGTNDRQHITANEQHVTSLIDAGYELQFVVPTQTHIHEGHITNVLNLIFIKKE